MSDTIPRRYYTSERAGAVTVIRLRSSRFAGWMEMETPLGQPQRDLTEAVAAAPDPPWVALDLSQLAFAGGALLGALITAIRSAAARGGGLVLCAMTPDIATLIRTVDPHGKIFTVEATVEGAVARLTGGRR